MIVGHDANRELDAVFINSPLKNYDESPRRNDFTLPVLGLGYIASYSKKAGLNVGVLDAEALGLGITEVVKLTNAAAPRWVGLNLLAPTYRHSTSILRALDSGIRVMLGGHQAKAMPADILKDARIPRLDALVLGEGETRAERLLVDCSNRANLPNVFWRKEDGTFGEGTAKSHADKTNFLSPDIDALPFLDREFLVQDPFKATDGRTEANLVGSRGCPYDCSFCGAAKSANPDVAIRARNVENILEEMHMLSVEYGVTAFRFVDDLFLAQAAHMSRVLPRFVATGVAKKWVWDATGRINVLAKAADPLLDLIREAGCREVALGIESGSARVLQYIDKHISPEMTLKAVRALTTRGISVKGYFILGFPNETVEEMLSTVSLVHKLWHETAHDEGRFRCSVFEFRPYPGTPEWSRLIKSGRFTAHQMLNYEHVDLTEGGKKHFLLERDEFNFSVGIQFGEAPVSRVRKEVAKLMVMQKQKLGAIIHAC